MAEDGGFQLIEDAHSGFTSAGWEMQPLRSATAWTAPLERRRKALAPGTRDIANAVPGAKKLIGNRATLPAKPSPR
jgi:hypothetical protein